MIIREGTQCHILLSLPETPLGNVEECYRYFTSVLFCHGVRVSFTLPIHPLKVQPSLPPSLTLITLIFL